MSYLVPKCTQNHSNLSGSALSFVDVFVDSITNKTLLDTKFKIFGIFMSMMDFIFKLIYETLKNHTLVVFSLR